MKRTKFLIVLFAIIATVSALAGLCACKSSCGSEKAGYDISVDISKSTIIEVGDVVDYTQYFIVKDSNGNQIVVTESMLDTKYVDTSMPGSFTVKINVGGASESVTFYVVPKGSGTGTNPADLSTVLSQYSDSSKWNFAINYLETAEGTDDYEEYYEYRGDDILNRYKGEDGTVYTEYLSYDASAGKDYYYMDNGDGTYTKYDEDSNEYYSFFSYACTIYLTNIKDFTFNAAGDGYTAANPNDLGNEIIGTYTDSSWTKITVYIANGKISKIVAVLDDKYTMQYEFVKYGEINFKIPDAADGGSSGTTTTPTGTMESQTYNPSTFDNERLQDKLTTAGTEPDPSIGLPSTGNVTALVIPVKFSNTTISTTQLNKLNLAFNGTAEDTGWESVKTYYQKASYGKLNLSFDIAGVNMNGVDYYTSSKSSSAYAKMTATDEDGETYNNGDNVLLQEVLKYYENRLDLTKYDTNNDGAIDAVYLIYSASVDYKNADFYWAYVTWDFDETTYDGKDCYYYLFAGLGFMENSSNEPFPSSSMKINAATYIHETGHLLGLDDYYDYEENKGCNEGLGGADMMDATVGDQNVYSKMMLGWLDPTIVTTTKTITISSSQAKGDAILIPLNFNNSYFCEYLLIDLYSAQGLNRMHAEASDSYLYDGASYGVRIYHVSASINDPWHNDFQSFTDNNNSSSDIALIKLVEADGGSKLTGNNYATKNDLWKAGQSLSKVFPNYMRNDGKKVNFDISIVSASATSATITITYAA